MTRERFKSTLGAVYRLTLDDGAQRYYIERAGKIMALDAGFRLSLSLLRHPHRVADTKDKFALLALYAIPWIDRVAREQPLDADVYGLLEVRKGEFYDYLADIGLGEQPVAVETLSRRPLRFQPR